MTIGLDIFSGAPERIWLNGTQPSLNTPPLADTSPALVLTLTNSFSFVSFIYSQAHSSPATWGNWELVSSHSSLPTPSHWDSFIGWVCQMRWSRCFSPASQALTLLLFTTLWKMILSFSLDCVPSFLLPCQMKIITSDCFSLWQIFAMWLLLSSNSTKRCVHCSSFRLDTD